MRRSLIVFMLLLFASSVLAMGRAPSPNIKSGDKDLDAALIEIDGASKDPARARETERVMINKFSITQNQLDSLKKRGYTLSETYYLSLLAKQSGKKVNDVAALHAKGVGWGVLAKRLKVQAGDLNRLRVRLHKIKKQAVKEQKREKKQLKIHAPKPPKVKPSKRKPKKR
jgi:hypothetical protein